MPVEIHWNIGIILIPPALGFLSVVAYFDSEALVANVIGYAAVWGIVHHYSIDIWGKCILKLLLSSSLHEAMVAGFHQIKNPNKDVEGLQQINLKRYLRSQIYCIFAVVMGFYLLCTEHMRSWPHDLLFKWTNLHSIVFNLSAGHWMCSIVEDVMIQNEIVRHRKYKKEKFNDMFTLYFYGLMWHHIVTIAAYVWCLNSHHLSGLCVFGLLFEAPVLCMNVRDLLASYEKEFHIVWRDYLKIEEYNRLLTCQYFLWHFCRTLPCFLYPLSLAIWRRDLVHVPLYSRVVYHVLGCFFCYLNFALLAVAIFPTVSEDKARIRRYSRESDVEEGGGVYSSCSEDDDDEEEEQEQEEGTDQKHDEDCECDDDGDRRGSDSLVVGAAPQAMTMRDIYPSASPLKKTKMEEEKTNNMENTSSSNIDMLNDPSQFSFADVQRHNSSDDLWIVIDDFVYDLTTFHASHPGGSEILVNVGGTDATKAFRDVGHGTRAQKMMKQYQVGRVRRLSSSSSSSFVSDSVTGESNDNRNGISKVVDGVKVFTEESFLSTLPGTLEGVFDPECHYYVDSQPMLPCCALYLAAFVFLVGKFKAGDIFHYIDATTTSSSVAATTTIQIKDLSHHLRTTLLNVECLLIFSVTCLLFIGFFNIWGPSSIFGTEKHASSFMMWRRFTGVLRGNMHALGVMLALFCVSDVYILTLFQHDDAIRCFRVSLEMCFFLEIYFHKASKAIARRIHPLSVFLTEKDVLVLWLGLVIDSFFLWQYLDNGEESYNRFWKRPSFKVMSILFCAACARCQYVRSYAHALRDGSGSFHVTSNMLLLGLFYSSVFLGAYTSYTQVGPCLAGSVVTSCNTYTFIMENFDLCTMWAYVFWFLFIISFGTLIKWSSASFGIQCLSIATFALTCIMGHFDGGYIAFFVLLRAFGYVSTTTYKTLLDEGSHAPKHLYPAKQVEYVFRSIIANFISSYIAYPLVELSSGLLPDGQMFWMCPGPVFDLGEKADYGFLRMDEDIIYTSNSTKAMLQELDADPEAGAKGFVSDMVVLFPLAATSKVRRDTNYTFREVNLSSWASEEAAYNWYKNSPSHKKIVKAYNNGDLLGFSSMLGTLVPHPKRPIRWEVRCNTCRKLTEGPNVTICPHCNAEMSPMPYI